MPRGEGLRARISRVPGETPKNLLRQPFYLPAILGAFSWSEEAMHTEYETVRNGQFSQGAQGSSEARTLRSLGEISTIALEWDAEWLVEQHLDPVEVRQTLFEILRSRRAVDLTIAERLGPGRSPLVAMPVTFRSVAAEMREGEPDALYFSIGIKEWRDDKQDRRQSGGEKKIPTSHKLKAKDSLYSLAEKYYGSSVYWQDIAKANGIKGFGKSDPLIKHKRFKVGSKIKLPEIQMWTTISTEPKGGRTVRGTRGNYGG